MTRPSCLKLDITVGYEISWNPYIAHLDPLWVSESIAGSEQCHHCSEVGEKSWLALDSKGPFFHLPREGRFCQARHGVPKFGVQDLRLA
jgi:hypothetical protein